MQVDVKGRVSADSADMLLRLAIEGAGILRLSEHVVADAIQKEWLAPLLQSYFCIKAFSNGRRGQRRFAGLHQRSDNSDPRTSASVEHAR